MGIQIGDRVTYRDIIKDKIYIVIINDARDLTSKEWIEKQITDGYIEILKIERPKYEVVEEKKELLTEEERKALKDMIDNVRKFSCINISKIEIANCGTRTLVRFYNEDLLVSDIVTNLEFKDIERYKKYTLKELGLEEN